MSLKAGFAQTDITPPVGTRKAGWIIEIVSDVILDPLSARVAVFESPGEKIAFVQLDTIGAPRELVEEIRGAVGRECGFPAERIMISGTHNHAGPDVRLEKKYCENLVAKVVSTFGRALGNLQEAELGFGSTFQWGISQNRRVVMRDGTARTHGSFTDPNALFLEGPIDPEVAVIAARGPAPAGKLRRLPAAAGAQSSREEGEILGAIVNFACHACHHGGETALSAGYPGRLASEMKSRGVPVTLFLNGAAGNIHHADPTRTRPERTKEEMGRVLADDVTDVLGRMEFGSEVKLGSRSEIIRLPFRRYTEDDVRGTARGAQRFVDPDVYDRQMPELLKMIKEKGSQEAEVQVMFLGEHAIIGIPSDYFVQHGLRIKEECFPRGALVSGYTNGEVGYCPHEEAFARGGYETTFGRGSRLAPEAGRMLADRAIDLVRSRSA